MFSPIPNVPSQFKVSCPPAGFTQLKVSCVPAGSAQLEVSCVTAGYVQLEVSCVHRVPVQPSSPASSSIISQFPIPAFTGPLQHLDFSFNATLCVSP